MGERRQQSRSRTRPSAPVRALAGLIARFYLGRPEHAEAIALRYRTLRAFASGVLNEVAYRRGWRRAPALLSANFELTNRCNLKCTFCPTGNGTMTRARGRMSEPMFRRALAAARPLEFVLLFQWGEPLLVAELPAMIAVATRRGIRTMITTNGTLLDEGWCRGLLEAGLTRLTLSVDGDRATHEAIRGVRLEPLRDNLRRLRRMRDERGSGLGIDVSMVVNRRTERSWGELRRSWHGIADRVQAVPQFMTKRRQHPCREPSRGSLVVLADGSVTVCCADPDGEFVVGHIDEAPLSEILNNERMRAFRRAHFQRRFPELCRECGEYDSTVAGPRFER